MIYFRESIRRVKRIFFVKAVKEKLIFTLVLLAIFRGFTSFAIPDLNKQVIASLLQSTDLLQIVNLLSGGLFLSVSILSLGLGPYITASYIFQILAFAFPTLKEMYQSGPLERKMLTQYMRIATFPIAMLQSLSFIFGINRVTAALGLPPLLVVESTLQVVALMFMLTFGAYITMWIGELITQFGMGGGSSLIIAVGILASFPLSLKGVWDLLFFNWQRLILVVLLFILIVLSIVVTLSVRKIPVIYASRVRSSGGVGAPTDVYIPINPGGVMPVIFAVAVMSGLGFLLNIGSSWVINKPVLNTFMTMLARILNDPVYYNVTMLLLTVVFSFFSALLVLSPKNIAENLQKQGAFVPGIRPGKETEAYISRITSRVVFIGGMIVAGIAVLPYLFRYIIGSQYVQNLGLGFAGTSILIVVSVVIEIIKQLQSVETLVTDLRRYY